MKSLMVAIPLVVMGPALCAPQTRNAETNANVNSRYTVESVDVPESYASRLSESLKNRIQSLVGNKFSQELVDDVAGRLRKELRNRVVVSRVAKGTQPDHVRIRFEITERHRDRESASPRLVYHSRQNFTFGADISIDRENNELRLGALTDNDELVERYSGVRGGYRRQGLAGGRLGVGVEAASYRSQWNPAVEEGLRRSPEVPGIYRTRVHFEPSATITLFSPLTLQLGVGLERLQTQFPAVQHELSGAALATLRYQRRWELTPGERHDVEASYSIRSGTRALESDFVFTRHQWEAGYAHRGARDAVMVNFQAGLLQGRAPLMERFTLGNSRTLRGWNRFDVDALGGERMAHGSLEYRYRHLRMVYDTGAVWRRGGPAVLRHSAAIGLASSKTGGFSALIAFPIHGGAITPIFVMGINF